jgi:hypothetical protein
MPLPQLHLIRYSGCWARPSQLRGAIIPTPRQQGVDGSEARTGTLYWNWARFLGRVFALDLEFLSARYVITLTYPLDSL